MSKRVTRVVLFDLGGVLFQFAGIRIFGQMIGEPSEDDVLREWVTNPWVQRYDRGRCSSAEFAAGMVAHYALAMDADEFLANFRTWVPGPHAGALDLVRATKASGVVTACLSNTNEAHWTADNGLARFVEQFDHCFLSFEIGHVKPESGAFAHVTEALGCRPPEILFLDDVQVNIDAARAFGIDANYADGVETAGAVLRSRSLLGESV
ncbi:MAG: HAD family phosphatase [Proteobacteria bacterium]|nr:HAD family phosphatase [Pseudomonadota bacterium]